MIFSSLDQGYGVGLQVCHPHALPIILSGAQLLIMAALHVTCMPACAASMLGSLEVPVTLRIGISGSGISSAPASAPKARGPDAFH